MLPKNTITESVAIWFTISAPSVFEMIDTGIITVFVDVPPPRARVPGTLFINTTALAPAFCAFFALTAKAHVPL